MDHSYLISADPPAHASRRGPSRDPGKRADIADAARRLLTAQGVRLTQVADVAREAGVAVGTIYLYAADKEALIELAIRSAARLALPSDTAPSDPARVAPLVREAVTARFAAPVLERAAHDPPAAARLGEILAEAYDLVARERDFIRLLDRCAREVAAIDAAWHGGVRGRYLDALERCVRRYAAAGVIRDDLDLATAARAVFEMIVWAAMGRPDDPVPLPTDETAARATAIALGIAALAPPPSPRT